MVIVKEESVEHGIVKSEPPPEKVSFKQRCKDFFVTHKAKIIKLSIVILVIAAFTTGCWFLFDWLGLMHEDTASVTMKKFGIWIYVMFILLFVIQALCLCMIPGNTLLFITIAGLVFNNIWIALLLCVIGVWLAGIALFFVGRYGGRKVVYWLFGREQVEKQLDWVTQKGASVMPAFFLVPFMPNDMLCMICGMSKLRFWQFLLIIIPFRVIEVLLILSYPYILGFFVKDRPLQDVLIFINIAIIDLLLIALYYRTMIRIFRKYFLRKKYVMVEKPYTVQEEVRSKSKPK